MRAPEQPARVLSDELDEEFNLTFEGVDGKIIRISVTHQQVEALTGGRGEPLGDDTGEDDNVTGHKELVTSSSIMALVSTHPFRQTEAAQKQQVAAVQATPA